MGPMNWERIEPWDYVVVSVAAEYHKRFNMVELADIKQSLYQWFLEHPNKLDEWEAIGPKDAKNLIYRSLRNQALDYCQRWKAKSLGYDINDLYYYDIELVEDLLPAVLRGEITEPPKLNFGMPGKPPAPSEGGNMMAMMAEIDSAYKKLNIEDKIVLFRKYAESLEYAVIANEMGLASEDAARMRHNRALKKLVTRLGGFKPHHDPDSSPQHETSEYTQADSQE